MQDHNQHKKQSGKGEGEAMSSGNGPKQAGDEQAMP